uniref:Uncharacterized protein n=1 Tax=Peronospora matthiolae TaxID=2874970 RepID=A0AAV1TZN9_9STRA
MTIRVARLLPRYHVGIKTHILVPLPHLWRLFSSQSTKKPHNLFEIDLNPLKASIASAEKPTLDYAKRALELQPTQVQRNLDLLHNEMSELFGEEVAESNEEWSSPRMDSTPLQNGKEMYGRMVDPMSGDFAGAKSAPDISRRERPPMMATSSVQDAFTSTKADFYSRPERRLRDGCIENEKVDLLLLHGPCSFVRDVWTGGDVPKKELKRHVQKLADDLKIVVKIRHYDSEKGILKKLLGAHEDQVIVLCWNISLSKSPFIVRALELIQSNTIILSPGNVEHGPLPATVVGVLSGFRNQCLSLALNAAADLLKLNAGKGRKAC